MTAPSRTAATGSVNAANFGTLALLIARRSATTTADVIQQRVRTKITAPMTARRLIAAKSLISLLVMPNLVVNTTIPMGNVKINRYWIMAEKEALPKAPPFIYFVTHFHLLRFLLCVSD
jgi:hypothetical protein